MSEDNQNPPEDTEETQEPSEPLFTQEQVNALLAKERNTAARKAKKEIKVQMAQNQPKETVSGAEQTELAEMIASVVAQQLSPVVQRVDQIAEKSSESEFESKISGLEIDEKRRSELAIFFKHDRGAFDSAIADERAKDAKPQPRGPGYGGLDAPNPTPSADRLSAPQSWTRDEINTMKANGTFMENIRKYADKLPGSGGGLFPAKNPGKK